MDFLKEEVNSEQEVQKQVQIPTEIDGFKVKLTGAEVELLKQSGDES